MLLDFAVAAQVAAVGADQSMEANQRDMDAVQERRCVPTAPGAARRRLLTSAPPPISRRVPTDGRNALAQQIKDVEREQATVRAETQRLERRVQDYAKSLAALRQRLEARQSLETSKQTLEAEIARARVELEVRSWRAAAGRGG